MRKYRIYFPSKDKNGIAIPRDEREVLIQYSIGKLVLKFGGCTAIPADGYFRHRHGMIVSELVDILEVLTDVQGDIDPPIYQRDIEAICEFIKVACNQECVLFERVDEYYKFI